MALLASGYFLMLVPAVLLPFSLALRMPLFGFLIVFLLGTVTRSVFGDVVGSAPEWTESAATVLEWLPTVTSVTYFFSTALTIAMLRTAPGRRGLPFYVEFGASMWAVYLLVSCLAHELLHRKDKTSRNLGRVLSGIIGYPVLEIEHQWHHHHIGDARSRECARVDETVWEFSFSRIRRILMTMSNHDFLWVNTRSRHMGAGLVLASTVAVCTAGAFGWALGFAGVVLFVCVSMTVWWSLQVINYIQHWGLGSATRRESNAVAIAWEDRCRLQYWLTLGISFHQAHHEEGDAPYYRMGFRHKSPKAPASYFFLFFASLVPPLWRYLMLPALERWKASPESQPSAGRKLVCIPSSRNT